MNAPLCSIYLFILAGSSAAAEFIDAREHGCLADYQRIACAITADGQVTRAAGARFAAGDAGKVLIIDDARVWPAYSLDPVPLNARIMAVADGVATVQSIDEQAQGSILANPKTTAEFFTDNTDAIAQALAAQVSGKLPYVQLPADGIIGLCPFISRTWATNPIYDNHFKTRALFVMKDGALLKGHGMNKTRLKIGYFGEFDPFRGAPYRFSPVVFMFEPVNNKTTSCGVEAFTVEFPFSPVVLSGYSFIADGWNTSAARHALQASVRGIATVNPQRNTVAINSTQGGIYGPGNELLAESKYVIEDCDFETAGGNFKNQNPLKPGQRGGKSVHFTNVTVRGGGNIITRHYVDCGSLQKSGDDLFLSVEQKDFTWKDFNAHSDQTEGAFNPVCLVRKAHKGVIRSIAPDANGAVRLVMDKPAPVSKAAGTLLIAFGGNQKQIYLEGAASLTAGSPEVVANLNGALLNAEQTSALTGAEIRVYYDENFLKAIYGIDSIKRIKLDRSASPDYSLLGQTGLDVTVNFEASRGAFGHTFYVGHNVSIFANGLQIHDCAKRSFRVSSGGSEAANGAHELTGYEVHPSRGMAAFCNRTTVFAAAEEFGGLLKMRRSKASSVYGVVLDMDEGSTYTAQGGIYGPGVIKNSTVSGACVGGGKTIIEGSTVGLRLVRLSNEGNFANSGVVDDRTPHLSLTDCQGSITFQNGIVEASQSRLQINFQGEPTEYEEWKNAIQGRYSDCEFTGYVTGLHAFTPVQRADFAARQSVVNSGVDPAASTSGSNISGIFSAGHKPYPQVLPDGLASFQLGVKNACGVRPAHLFALMHAPKSALYIDSRFNSFRVATPFLDDILINAYQHGASSPDLIHAQMEYNETTEITVVPEVDNFQLRATGKIKPSSLQPRAKGEPIVLRWNPAQFRWIERPRQTESRAIPDWNGMNGEFVADPDPASATRGWKCVYDVSPPAILEISSDHADTLSRAAIYLGYEDAAPKRPDNYLHFSKDGGATWIEAFPSQLDKAYAQSAELQVDWLAGKVRNLTAQKKQLRYQTNHGIRWEAVSR